MDNPNPRLYPPVRIWLLVCVVGAMLAAIVFYLEESTDPFEYASREAYMKKVLEVNPPKRPIFIFGTSLVECDLDSTDRLIEKIEPGQKAPFTVVKIWRHGATLSSIVDHMPSLRQFQPTLVVVGANMLFYRVKMESLMTRCIQTYRGMVGLNLPYQHYFPDSKSGPSQFPDIAPDSSRNGTIDTADLQSFRQLAEVWQAKGTRFVLINFPLDSVEESKKWNSGDTAQFFQNLRYLRQRISIAYYDPPVKLGPGYYYDHAHMNPAGCKLFSLIFCQELTLQLQSL
jgi:hypothetical protein